MKRIIAVLILLALAAGCGNAKRKAWMPETFIPGPHRTAQERYLTGFMDGYSWGVHPLDPHSRHRHGYSAATPYRQGVRDGYATARNDKMQQR
jgi:hypothetical protein